MRSDNAAFIVMKFSSSAYSLLRFMLALSNKVSGNCLSTSIAIVAGGRTLDSQAERERGQCFCCICIRSVDVCEYLCHNSALACG